ncbi:uncharacterized protein LOC111708213 isoform X4 [Eurytemora carolleeae]|uniref:uncharacterized protein LOC111708213 isoform X4 n=2 Tax=Eurytemora carolleeae TaxID=1294199 RepID=UPI000C755CF5|nr:uncharacterized protein LOC111708213 isoform X4 [Eurytemora carolleeae]|eukprot:XP_023337289.1 uncharacterized protein LOC111708213 isoform X4 [Eurytemora affinis]
MVRFRIISIFLLFLPVSPLYSEIISVVQGEQGNLQTWSCKWMDYSGKLYKEVYSNWLELFSNERYEDDLQAVGAGLAEGYLTSQLILHYYKEFIAKDLCIPDPKFCTWVLEILHTNKKWALEQEVSNKTDYWKMVRLFYKQMEGMKQGLKMKNPDKTGLELVEMKYEDIVLLINFLPNLGDFLQKYKSEKRKVSFPSCSALGYFMVPGILSVLLSSWSRFHISWFQVSFPSCSALIQVLYFLVPGILSVMLSFNPGLSFMVSGILFVLLSSNQVFIFLVPGILSVLISFNPDFILHGSRYPFRPAQL